MQKISIVIIAASLFAAQTMAQETSGSIMIDEVGLNVCFQTSERLERLTCYDKILERNEVSDTPPAVQPETQEFRSEPTAVMFSRRLLGSNAVEKGGSYITLLDRVSGEALTFEGERGILELLDSPVSDEAFQTLRQEYDLYVAIKSKDGIGEKTVLVASCQNNITRLKIYFHTPFEGRTEVARFYSGESFSEDNDEARRMWIRAEGFVLENARGLDSIKLLKQLRYGLLGQISFGDGDDVRSSFFDTSSLNTAIPFLSRHCSWRNN